MKLSKAKHLVSLSTAAAVATLGSNASGAEVQVSQTAMVVQHVTVSSPKPYESVRADLETRLAKLDDRIRALLKEKSAEPLRAAVTQAAAKDGFLWHYTAVHGDWLILKDRPNSKVITYFIGNVISASEMTNANYAAGLYAPLRIVLYESAKGGSTIEYDTPSSQLSQYHSADIDAVGKSLDDRLSKLVASTLAP